MSHRCGERRARDRAASRTIGHLEPSAVLLGEQAGNVEPEAKVPALALGVSPEGGADIFLYTSYSGTPSLLCLPEIVS